MKILFHRLLPAREEILSHLVYTCLFTDRIFSHFALTQGWDGVELGKSENILFWFSFLFSRLKDSWEKKSVDRLYLQTICLPCGFFLLKDTADYVDKGAEAVVPFEIVAIFKTQKIFHLLLRVFPLKRKKITNQGRTRTVRIRNCLHYHYSTTPTRQNFEKFKYINQQIVFLNWYISNSWPKFF